jgi:hypothetical protein
MGARIKFANLSHSKRAGCEPHKWPARVTPRPVVALSITRIQGMTARNRRKHLGFAEKPARTGFFRAIANATPASHPKLIERAAV